MRTARSPPSVCASAPPRLPFFCRRRGQAAVVGHRKRCMAWTSSPRPAEVANDPPQPRAAALCRQCQRHPRGERGKDSVCHPRDRSRAMAAATTGLTVYVRFSEGRIWLIALCRPARRERRGQPTPPAKGRGGGGPCQHGGRHRDPSQGQCRRRRARIQTRTQNSGLVLSSGAQRWPSPDPLAPIPGTARGTPLDTPPPGSPPRRFLALSP